MPSPRKYHPHGGVLFVTMSLEEGVMLLPNPLCDLIITTCLAQAQTAHPVTICHYIAEGTHMHMLVVVDNPEDVPGFVGRFKTESAHMFNAVLGRKKRTVWCDGYDSPVVLTLSRALEAIAYLYANPAKDGLEDSIDYYPAASSWRSYCSSTLSKRVSKVPRRAFRTLTPDGHNLRGYAKEATRLRAQATDEVTITIEPDAWMNALGVENARRQEELNGELHRRVRQLEAEARAARKVNGKRVIGAHRLIAQPIDRYYRSKRRGRRMWCLSDDVSLRIRFINHLKNLIEAARLTLERWRCGDLSFRYPLGLYPPLMPKLAEPLPDG